MSGLGDIKNICPVTCQVRSKKTFWAVPGALPGMLLPGNRLFFLLRHFYAYKGSLFVIEWRIF
jgi:hypothetical protein